jgi:hypothetical protein
VGPEGCTCSMGKVVVGTTSVMRAESVGVPRAVDAVEHQLAEVAGVHAGEVALRGLRVVVADALRRQDAGDAIRG